MAQKNGSTSGAAEGGNGEQQNASGTNGTEELQNLLEADADGDNGEGGTDGENGGGDGGAGEGEGNGTTDIAAAVKAALQELLPSIQDSTNREIDRRVNGALNKVRKPGAKPQQQQDEGNDGDGGTAPVVADVRGARLAFREYLPDQIRFLSPEEKALATEFGLTAINAKAAKGFDDEDAAGREAAAETVAFLKKARRYYSDRTKRALEKSGALKQDGQGQTSHGTTPPGVSKDPFERAKAKMAELGMKPAGQK